jgi:hypothetical protein
MFIESTVSQGLSKSVAFVDRSIADYKSLLAGLPEGAEVQFIEPNEDGVLRISQWAEENSGYEAIHIFSRGSARRLQLGKAALTHDTVENYAPLLKKIGPSLSAVFVKIVVA